MLTGELLPRHTVIASHLFKKSWAKRYEYCMGLDNIHDIRNGLLLWKPVEYALDTGGLTFIYDSTNER
jgi:hypothetical protein